MAKRQRQELSEVESSCLAFLKAFLERHGYAPSQAQIAQGVNKSIGTIHGTLLGLERKRYIKRPPRQNRAVTIL